MATATSNNARPERGTSAYSHRQVSCVIPGGKSPAEVRSNVALINVHIPAAFWAELKSEGLLPADVRTP